MAEVTATDPVLVERRGPLLTIVLNRPERKNAMNVDGWSRLQGALDVAKADDHVRVVVVTGAGGDFCSGADIGPTQSRRHPLSSMRWIGDIALALHDLPKPVIAKVNGVAVGAGCNLALCCDLVVASSTARFSQIFARRGLSVDFGGSWLLPRTVGLQQAKRLVMLADFVDAHEALQLGLVTWIKEPDEIDDFVGELATRLAAAPPIAIAQSKAMLNAAANQTMKVALEAEAAAQTINFATDGPAARAAFEAKREPVFDGRWQP